MMLVVHLTVVLLVVMSGSEGLPCLSQYSKEQFDLQRTALKDLASAVKTRVGNIESEIELIMNEFRKKDWKTYGGHCYFFGTDAMTWFDAEHHCNKIGGYLTKVTDQSENKWLSDNMKSTHKSAVSVLNLSFNKAYSYYWIGLTDLKEGEWRWSYDQSLAKYKPWDTYYGSKGTSVNCVAIRSHYKRWRDVSCSTKYYYVCESNLCY